MCDQLCLWLGVNNGLDAEGGGDLLICLAYSSVDEETTVLSKELWERQIDSYIGKSLYGKRERSY